MKGCTANEEIKQEMEQEIDGKEFLERFRPHI